MSHLMFHYQIKTQRKKTQLSASYVFTYSQHIHMTETLVSVLILIYATGYMELADNQNYHPLPPITSTLSKHLSRSWNFSQRSDPYLHSKSHLSTWLDGVICYKFPIDFIIPGQSSNKRHPKGSSVLQTQYFYLHCGEMI